MKDAQHGHGQASRRPRGTELIGYAVEAVDGHVGKVGEHSEAVGDAYLVVDTGPWIFGRQVLLPADAIVGVDAGRRTVRLDRSREDIRNAPRFDAERHLDDPRCLEELTGYYGRPHM